MPTPLCCEKVFPLRVHKFPHFSPKTREKSLTPWRSLRKELCPVREWIGSMQPKHGPVRVSHPADEIKSQAEKPSVTVGWSNWGIIYGTLERKNSN